MPVLRAPELRKGPSKGFSDAPAAWPEPLPVRAAAAPGAVGSAERSAELTAGYARGGPHLVGRAGPPLMLQAARLLPQRRCKGKSDGISGGGEGGETGQATAPRASMAVSVERGKREERTGHQPPPGAPRRHSLPRHIVRHLQTTPLPPTRLYSRLQLPPWAYRRTNAIRWPMGPRPALLEAGDWPLPADGLCTLEACRRRWRRWVAAPSWRALAAPGRDGDGLRTAFSQPRF